jgi:hypothetical protein
MFDKCCVGYEAIGYTLLLPASALPGWPQEVPLPVDPQWLDTHERQTFAAEASPPPAPVMKTETGAKGTALETLRLHRQGLSVEQIATQRGLVTSTIHNHLAQAIQHGELQADPRDYYTAEQEAELRAAAAEHGFESLGKLKEALGNRYDYPTLHYFRAFELRRFDPA